MLGELVPFANLDTFLLRGLSLTRIDPAAYPFAWRAFVSRCQYAAMAGDARWHAEMIPVLVSDDAMTIVTHGRVRRAWRRREPCGVIERIDIPMADGDRAIVAAVPAGPATTDQEIRIYASRPGAISRARALFDSQN